MVVDDDFDNGIDNRDQNRDDKLTQSQMLKRMLEAEERDNQRDRHREQHADSRDQDDRNRLNEARMMVIPGTPESRGRRGGGRPPGAEEGDAADEMSETDGGYVSSSMASSFDYRALTDEEK